MDGLIFELLTGYQIQYVFGSEYKDYFKLWDRRMDIPKLLSNDTVKTNLICELHNSIVQMINNGDISEYNISEEVLEYINYEYLNIKINAEIRKRWCEDEDEDENKHCHVCGKTDVELFICECCDKHYCYDCGATYSIHNQIDYDCCCECEENMKEDNW